MDFIENNQTVVILFQKQRWIMELVSIFTCLKIEVERIRGFSYLERQSGFSDLARTKKSHSSLTGEGFLNFLIDSPRNRSCILQYKFLTYKDMQGPSILVVTSQ